MDQAAAKKIMVVDDEPDLEMLMRQKYRRLIKANEIEFFFAENGQDALDKLKDLPDIDIVLTDINMPKMDGLTLLGYLPDMNPILKTVIVSAYGDIVNTAQRYQSIADPGQIIIGENVKTQILDIFTFEEIGSVSLKNKTKPQTIFNIL